MNNEICRIYEYPLKHSKTEFSFEIFLKLEQGWMSGRIATGDWLDKIKEWADICLCMIEEKKRVFYCLEHDAF